MRQCATRPVILSLLWLAACGTPGALSDGATDDSAVRVDDALDANASHEVGPVESSVTESGSDARADAAIDAAVDALADAQSDSSERDAVLFVEASADTAGPDATLDAPAPRPDAALTDTLPESPSRDVVSIDGPGAPDDGVLRDAAPADASTPDAADASPVDATADATRVDVLLVDSVDAAADATPETGPDATSDAPTRESGFDASFDAPADVVVIDAPLDVQPDVLPDVLPDVQSDVVADALPACLTYVAPRCTGTDASDLLTALRAPRGAGISAVAAPGQRFEDLRARFDADATATALLASARTTAHTTPSAPANAAAFQTVASRALTAALVAWHDHDAVAARTALAALAACAQPYPWFLATADELPILVGAGIVDLAGALDLLGATPEVASADLTNAQRALATVMVGVEAWLQAGGQVYMNCKQDNHGMRLGAGVIAASMVTPTTLVSDDLFAWGLAHTAVSMRAQTGGTVGWAEGSTYFEYAFEVAAVALAAVDRGWSGADARCVRCNGHAGSVCGSGGAIALLRPSADPIVRDLVRWSASLESNAGWLHPFDDSRLMGVPAPLLEQLAGFRAFSHWSATGPLGSIGGQVTVGPFVALALATGAPATRMPRVSFWPSAGTARVDTSTTNGLAFEAFLLGENGAALGGLGHERPDVLGLALAAGGTMVLGPSGYRDYDGRGPLAQADANSIVTVEGVLPRALAAGESGPSATLVDEGGPVAGSFDAGGVRVSRRVTAEATAVVVRDEVTIRGAARDVAWHWHLRGTMSPSQWSWTVGSLRCDATQSGLTLPVTRETAVDYDDYSIRNVHPVVRQSVTLSAGTHAVETRFSCGAGS